MKTFSRITSFILALAMLLGNMCMPTYATDTNATETEITSSAFTEALEDAVNEQLTAETGYSEAAEPAEAEETEDNIADGDFEVELMATKCTYYMVTDDNTIAHEKHDKDSKTKATYNNGDTVKIVDDYKKLWGTWYKTSLGYWIFGSHLQRLNCTAKTASVTKNTYVKYSNDKHEIITKTTAEVCKHCGNTIKSASSSSKKEAHNWEGAGKCSDCGYQYVLTGYNYGAAGTYLVTGDNTSKKQPYSAASNAKYLTKGMTVTVKCSVKNAYENKWYQLDSGEWVYEDYLSKHIHSTYTETGKCSCGKTLDYNDIDCLDTSMVLKESYSTRTVPFPNAAVNRSLTKGYVVTVTRSNGAIKPTWYKTADGDWIPASKLSQHYHSYKAGYCTSPGCGAEYTLKIKWYKTAKQYETVGPNKVVREGPYAERAVIETLSKTGTVIEIDAETYNSAGHLWYHVKNSGWIYYERVTLHTHRNTVSGRCPFIGCGYDYGVNPTSYASNVEIKVTEKEVTTFSLPYSDSTAVNTYKNGSKLYINAEFVNYRGENASGNLWYRLTDGSWIYSGSVEVHEHSYSKGICSCGKEQPLPLKTMSPAVYVTVQDDVPVWSRPYNDSGKKYTIGKNGTSVTIVGYVTNDANHKWYKTSDGYWIYAPQVSKTTTVTVTNSANAAKEEYKIKVTDQNQKVLSGATVTFGSQSAVTDSSGYATLQYSSSASKLTVSLSGYGTYENSSYSMNKYRTDSVIIVKEGYYTLTKAELKHNGYINDVTATEVTLNQASNNLSFDLYLKSNVANPQEYRLVQGGKVKATSSSGNFYNLSADTFEKNKTVSVYVIDSNGSIAVNQKLMLNVTYSNSTIPGSLSLGKSLKATIPDDAPFPFAGMVINIGSPILPCDVDLTGDYIRIALNFKLFDSSKTPEEKQSAWEQLKSLNANKFDGFYKKNAIDINKDIGDYASPFAFDVKMGGYLEGSTKENYLKGKLFISLSCSVSSEMQLATPIPLVAEISFEGSVSADGTFKLNTETVKVTGNLAITLKASIGAYIGVGYKGIASVGVYGKGTVSSDIAILPEFFLKEIKATANFGVKAKLLGKEALNATIIQLGDYYIYQHGASLSEYDAVTSDDINGIITDTDNYTTMDRSYLDTRSGWYEPSVELMDDESVVVSDFDFDIMQSDAYTDIKPQVVTTEDVIMMVYVDDNSERADDDRTMLVYSLFHTGTGEWSAPVAVYDDTTADYNFSVHSTGTDIFVVWQNANSLISSDMDITAISKNTDLMIAKYDAVLERFVDIEQVTVDNEVCEMMPRVAAVEGNTIVTWFVNSEDDVFAKEGTNTIHFAQKVTEEYSPSPEYNLEDIVEPDGSITEEEPSDGVVDEEEEETVPEPWKDITVEGEQPSITSLAVGYMLDYGYIAFTVDGDGNDLTVDDQLVRIIDVADPSEIIDYTNIAMNVEFTKVHGDNALTWYNQGYIFYSIDPYLAPQKLYDKQGIPATEYHIISSSSGDMAVLYTLMGDNQSDAYMILYDDDTYEWGLPIQITKQDKYIQCFNGAYFDNMIVSVFNQTDITLEDLFEKTNFCCAVVDERYDLVIEDVIFDDIDLEPLGEYPVTVNVRNNGTVRLENVILTVEDANGVIADKTFETAIRPGETVSIETTVTMPETVVYGSYTVTVSHEYDSSDSDISDNISTFDAGKALLKLEADHAVIDESNLIYINVINTGYAPTNGSIVLYDDDGEIDKVLYDNIGVLENGGTFACTVELSPDEFDGAMYKNFRIGVIADEEQSTDVFNSKSFLIKNSVVPEEAKLEVNTVDLYEDVSEVSLMGEFEKTVSGSIENVTEEDIINAKLCVIAYDMRGIYIDTWVSDAEVAVGDSLEFVAEFDTNVEISSINVMLIDSDNMQILADNMEITMVDVSENVSEESDSSDTEDIAE